MNDKLTPNEEEQEKQRREILVEINKTNNEYKKNKKKNFIIIFSSILVIIIFIKIVFGTIDIPNIFKYPSNKARFYKVTLNGELITSEYFLTQKIPIIPYLINLKSECFDQNYVVSDNDGTYYNANNLDEFIIDINSYSCYYMGYQTKCKDSNQEMEKNDDVKFTRLTIYRTTNPHEEIYNGKFVNDITPYIKDKGKGVYSVSIYAEYSYIETTVNFTIKIEYTG